MVISVAGLVNDAIVLAGVVGTVFGFGKSKYFQAALTFAKGEEKQIVAVAEELVHTPIAKTIEAKLHHDLNNAHDDLKKSELAQYALAVVHGAGKLYDELPSSEQAASIQFIKLHLPKGIDATEKEIVDALKSAPDIAQLFVNDPAFKKAQEFTQLLNNANVAPATDAQPAQAPVAQ